MSEKRHQTYLLTPGPLTTANDIKHAMLFDKSPNSPEMVQLVGGIRDYLVSIANGEGTYECIPVQGSATYGIEAAFQTLAGFHRRLPSRARKTSCRDRCG